MHSKFLLYMQAEARLYKKNFQETLHHFSMPVRPIPVLMNPIHINMEVYFGTGCALLRPGAVRRMRPGADRR